MGLFDSIFGKRNNVERGKEIEDDFKARAEFQGDNVERTGIGSDYKRTTVDPWTGKKRTEHWDMKRNNSPVSKRQMKTRGLKIYRSVDTPLGKEVRLEDKHGNRLERNIITGKLEKVPKKQSDPFGLNALGGSSTSSSSKSRRSKANEDPFGIGSMFGSSGSSGKRKRKKSDDFFGWG